MARVITKSNIKEAIVGTFSAVLFFYILRQEPMNFNPLIGLIITILWVSLIYSETPKKFRKNFWLDLIMTIFVCSVLALLFNLTTIEQLFSFNIFGSVVIVGLWLGLPIAVLFDYYNSISILKRQYIRKRL